MLVIMSKNNSGMRHNGPATCGTFRYNSPMQQVGVDIIEISRVTAVLRRHGSRFLNRIFTPTEIEMYAGRPSRLASRFAAKEAIMKVLGTGARGVKWREIEIDSEPGGRPIVWLHGKARARAEQMGLISLAISLSDSKEYAVAFAVGEFKTRQSQSDSLPS
jgi:holo-[acyl-carrier protein] synthase